MIDLEKLRALGTRLVNLDSESGEGLLILLTVAQIERLQAALKPFADLANRKEYTLDDVPHGLMINAWLTLRGLHVVDGIVQPALGGEER